MTQGRLVTPYPSLIEVFALDGESYRLAHAYRADEAFRSVAFKGLKLNLRRVFDFPLEPGEEIPMVKEGRPPYGTPSEQIIRADRDARG